MRTGTRMLFGALLVWGGVLSQTTPGEAHKSVTSKYFYNEDVFPVFREHCGRCHVDGGVAPMSLMTYDDAFPWAESLRIELLADAIPAWHPLKLTARELDLVLVWATGGAPRGKADAVPPAVTLDTNWPSGAPDFDATMPAPFTLEGAAAEATHDVEFALTAAAGKMVRAIDLKPGTPAIVRSATLLLKSAGAAPRPLAEWVPGQPAAVSLPTPVRIPPGATLVTRILYKRTWKYEGQPLTDTSTIGLYYADAPARRPTGRPR